MLKQTSNFPATNMEKGKYFYSDKIIFKTKTIIYNSISPDLLLLTLSFLNLKYAILFYFVKLSSIMFSVYELYMSFLLL